MLDLPATNSQDPYLVARTARRDYEQTVDSDGATEGAWLTIASQLWIAADGLLAAGGLAGPIEVLRSRAIDAEQRADLARRMVIVARQAASIIEVR